MTEEIECETDAELETVKSTLEQLGISYRVTRVVEVEASADCAVLPRTPSEPQKAGEQVADGGVAVADDATDDPTADSPDDSGHSAAGLPDDDTIAFRVAKAVGTHDKAWVTLDDLGVEDPAERNRLSSHIGALANRGVLRKKADVGTNSRGQPLNGYRLTESLRREIAQYDDLNSDGDLK